MSNASKNYTIGYFFAVQHPTHAEQFAQYFLKALRTIDPDAPDDTQPELMDDLPNTVGFVENVNSQQLREINSHVQKLVVSAFTSFLSFSDQIDGRGMMGVTIHFTDNDDRKAAIFVQSAEGRRDALAFAYQVGHSEGEVLTPDTVTQVSDGKTCMDAVLAFYGELQNVTGEAAH